MVSKKVFCGAIRPRITGIRERVEPRLSRRSEPWFSAAVDTKPGRNLDEVPGAPPNPWRRAPSRDTRDSTVSAHRPPMQVIPADRRRERSRYQAGRQRTEGWRGARRGCSHLRTSVLQRTPPPQPTPSLSCTHTFLAFYWLFPFFFSFFFFCLPLWSSDQRLLKSSRLVLDSLHFRRFLFLFHT